MRASDLRRMALGRNGAVEGAHQGHPDFRVDNRIFATLHHDERFGMVKLTPQQQAEVVRAHPRGFAPESGAWGRAGCTRITLDEVEEDTLEEVVTLAWQNALNNSSSRKRTSGRRAK